MRRQHTMNAVSGFAGVMALSCLVVGLVVAGVGTPPAIGASAFLDPDFGDGGLVLTDFTSGEDGANAIATTDDSFVVATGFGDLGEPSRPHVGGFGFARYRPDGSPDPDFSGDGRTLIDFGSVNQAATTADFDSTGRIVATGTITTFDGSTSSIGLARLLADGTPDPNFGDDGRVTIQPGTLSASYDAAIDSQDRIVVIGAATGAQGFRPIVMRFAVDGSLDPSFGSGGIRRFGRVTRDSYGSIAIDDRGRLLLAGTSRPSGAAAGVPAVRRMSASGSLDRDYGRKGFARPLGRLDGGATDLVVDATGRTVVAAPGECGPGGDDDFAIARLMPRGRPDDTFGRDGRVCIPFSSKDARPSTIAIDGSSRVIVGGSVRVGGDNDWALARLEPNGGLDRSFGDRGTVSASLGAGVEGIREVAVDAEAHVLAAGLGLGPLGSDFAVARFR